VIVFHGTDDAMVPITQGRDLAEACESARFIEIPGGSHNEIPMHRLRIELQRIRAKMTEEAHNEASAPALIAPYRPARY
jgi:pimeloyl-ACP methyl ester carboxylesterase